MMCGSYALQSGGDSMALGTGRGMKQALGACQEPHRQITPSGPLLVSWLCPEIPPAEVANVIGI